MNNPRLHPDTIEDVKQRTDIVDVISDYVVLKKRGKDFQGLCPFHDEKTPSFSVSPGKQMYYCFGCGAGGNSIKFLMELRKQSFSEVVFDLARRYQISIKTLHPEQHQELQRQLTLKEQLFEIMAVAASFYQHALRQSQGEIALDYLQQKRQLSEETIQSFQLGYAPTGWETLYRYLIEQKRYPVTLVEQAGLIKLRKTGSGYYDQFRDRLMIPILDTQGRVIAFGSRTLGNDEPKYLNSPETPLFDKSKTLFALDKARQGIIQADQAVIVEGYFDAIALHAADIKNVVASLGTAFSQDQLKQLLRYSESKQVIFNFDADNAGTQATQRAIEELSSLVYSGQVQLRVLNLPDGKDADEFLKSSSTAVDIYRQRLKDAPLWLDWQIQQLLKDKDLKQADHFQQAAKNMIILLKKLEDDNQRTHYIRYCAEILAQGDSRLISLQMKNLLAQLKKPSSQSAKFLDLKTVVSSDKKLLEKAEELLLLIYLHCPDNRKEILEALEDKDLLFSLSEHRFLWQQINQIEVEMDESSQLISLLQDRLLSFPKQQKQLNYFFHLEENTPNDLFRASIRIKEAIASLERVNWEKYRLHCLHQWQNLNPTEDQERWQFYFQEFYKAEQQIQQLDQLRMEIVAKKFMMKKLILAIGLFLISLFLSLQATASNITSIYAFGDSLSDTGNLFHVTGSPAFPYYEGRASNGQVWLEYLTQKLGLTDKKLTNFAFSGATSGSVNLGGNDSKLLGLQQQTDYFVNSLKKNQKVADSKALYIIWIAANDYIPYPSVDYTAIHFKSSDEPSIPINNIITAVNKVADVGAKKILVVNLPDLGKTPLANKTEKTVFLSKLTAKHNYQLLIKLNTIKSLTETKIFIFDINSLFQDVLNNPKKFNFKNVTDTCLKYENKDTAIICSNPNEYLFWDNVHPTTATHQIIGESAYRQINQWIK